MELKTKLLLNKFKNNSYFKNLNEYLTEKVSEVEENSNGIEEQLDEDMEI